MRAGRAMVVLEVLSQLAVAQRRVELVERKGLGHPDTICDALAEEIAIALNRMYRDRLGVIPHYNVDKALLVAGQCDKAFGAGVLTRPMALVVGDRATLTIDGVRLPVEETVHEAVRAWLADHLPRLRPERDVSLRLALAPGSTTLRHLLEPSESEVGSNDTCGASGYAPLSPTEALVLAIERFLNGAEFKQAFPDTGQDVKVFGLREDDRVSVTVAMPLACLDTPSARRYVERKSEILAALDRRIRSSPFRLEWTLNNLDRPERGADGVYLTLTGTSAEDADSGQVGRGNRANGLIAFSRPASAEAPAGKNPIAHAGKIYSVLSFRMAEDIHARCPELAEVYVHLAARIGDPVDRPWAAVQVVPKAGVAVADVEPAVRAVVEAAREHLPALRAELALRSVVA